ncbi:hypothetical protein ISCGN_023467 [Ixodes scapularis]
MGGGEEGTRRRKKEGEEEEGARSTRRGGRGEKWEEEGRRRKENEWMRREEERGEGRKRGEEKWEEEKGEEERGRKRRGGGGREGILSDAVRALLSKKPQNQTADKGGLVFCHLLNISQCEYTEFQRELAVVVYNPDTESHLTYVRLPVGRDIQLVVTDPDGLELEHQVLPVAPHSGTSTHEVAQDYANQLSRGIASCEEILSDAVRALLSKKPQNQTADKSGLVFCHLLNISQCEYTEFQREVGAQSLFRIQHMWRVWGRNNACSTTSATITLGFAPIGIATDFPPALPPARKAQAATMPNSADNAMEFDALSGRTLAPPGPWQQILRERRHLKNPPANPPRPSEPRQSTNRPPGTPAPRLPDSDYKVVFRPRTGLRVAAWNDRQLAQSLQRASKIPEYIFYARVTVQIQASQNLIVAGTPEENCALALSEISTIQLGAATHEVLPYLKPLPGTRRGVIHGLDPDTTTDQLPHILAYNGVCILHARMLGNSTSAVVTFEGIHVPFYIKAYGLFTRCRPYRQTVQCCSLCGELGHRQDVCPNPDTIMCAQCHTRDPTQDHDCTPKCQLCGLAHPTASKDCRKKLRSPPPPLRDRERALTSQRWQQQSSSNSQPPEQRQFPPNQPNQQQWKHADITLIPKPGKPLNPKNLRPISLTSCVGKLFEHMVHNRLSSHIEDKDYFPDTMYGFRPHLSTQDILLQLKEEVLDSLNNHSKRSILTLDIKGAFDNISHQAILQGVASTNCGERTYKYFASFLTNRTATVGIGHLRSDTFTTIPKGTPQGSVVSPLLFNIAMKDLPPLLQAIPNLHHAIYADDLTLWVPTGSTGDQQDALQAAIQLAVVVYNPDTESLLTYVRLPVGRDIQLVVTDPDGLELEHQVLPVAPHRLGVPERTSTAPSEIVFPALVPPLGMSVYKMEPGIPAPNVAKTGSVQDDFLELEQQLDYVENKRYRLELDPTSGLVTRVHLLGRKLSLGLRQSFAAYLHEFSTQAELSESGHYVFSAYRNAYQLDEQVAYRVLKGPQVQEVHQVFNGYISQVISLYNDSDFIDFTWTVGPLDFALMQDPEMLPIPSNYYPVVSWIYIKDTSRNLQVSVLPDRPQGGSSLRKGEIELMLHRRHSSNDQLGNAESLEESGANHRGLVVRGTHRVFVGTIDESWPRLRRRALQLVYRPLVAFAPPAFFRTFERTKYSGLLSPLPGTVHVLTLERVSSGQVLLRLEHLGFQNKTIQVNVTKLFRSIALTDVRAVTLGGNQFIEEASRLQWRTNQFESNSKPSAPKMFTTPAKHTIVTLLPRQIVTLLASLKMH